jgi:hypothetical protein
VAFEGSSAFAKESRVTAKAGTRRKRRRMRLWVSSFRKGIWIQHRVNAQSADKNRVTGLRPAPGQKSTENLLLGGLVGTEPSGDAGGKVLHIGVAQFLGGIRGLDVGIAARAATISDDEGIFVVFIDVVLLSRECKVAEQAKNDY